MDCGLTGETLPLLPAHPLKWPDLLLFADVQSKDQMAASHLEGLLAGPDSSKTRVCKNPASARVAQATAHRGSRPAVAPINVQDRQVRLLPVRLSLSLLPLQSLNLCALLAPAPECTVQAGCLHFLMCSVCLQVDCVWLQTTCRARIGSLSHSRASRGLESV